MAHGFLMFFTNHLTTQERCIAERPAGLRNFTANGLVLSILCFCTSKDSADPGVLLQGEFSTMSLRDAKKIWRSGRRASYFEE